MAKRRWINLQATLRRRLPSSLAHILDGIRHLPSFVQWWFSPEGRLRAEEVLGPMQGTYQGSRCVVIGNGPSLQKMELTALRDEFTFGLNRIYLMFDELGFETTFLCAINRFVLEQFGEEIGNVHAHKFLNWRYRSPILSDEATVYLPSRPALAPDGKVLGGYYAGGGTVTIFALQLAFFMGFSEVILIGVDHNYHEKGPANMAVISSDEDRSHFDRDYFGPGVTWQLPDLSAMERGFIQIRSLFARHGRQIIDATVDGKLEVFPKAEFKSLLRESSFFNRAHRLGQEDEGAPPNS